jgi:phosphoserine phosphatase
MNKNLIKAVILDLDQTLTTDFGSWLQFTTLLGADQNVHAEIFKKYKLGEMSYKKAKTELIDLWKITGKTNRQDVVYAFNRIKLRKGVLNAVKYLKRNYLVCIISGAIDIFVNVIADKLEINNFYASTKFIFNDKDELVDFEYKLSRGEIKLEYFYDFCSKNNLYPNECAAIGDGDSDMPIFEKVGLPILFLASETSAEQKEKIKVHISKWKEIYKIL